jgi:hypothetical protein
MAMNTKMKPPEGERRRELLVAALAEAVDRMLQLGRSPDEIRSRRLEDTMQLLFELEPQALAARQTSVDAALRTPTIRPAERPLEGAPYQRVFEVIERARRETPEAEAFTVLLLSLVGKADFPHAIRLCRNAVTPEHRYLVAETLNYYAAHGANAELRDIIWMFDNVPRSPPGAGAPYA